MLSRRNTIIVMAVLVLLLTSVAVVLAAGYDLTVVGTDATINGAIFETIAPTDPTGSGVFDAFLRVQKSPSEKGFNSDLSSSNFEFNEKSGTTSITLDEIPQVTVQSSGITYRIFELDINESGSEPNNLITLDLIQIFEAAAPDTCGYPFDGSVTCPGSSNTATLIYDMDAGENSFLVLDYNNNAGSGKRDLRLWVPDSLFDQDPNCTYQSPTANSCTTYIVLYNEFGLDSDGSASAPLNTAHSSEAGFEEWGVPLEQLPTAVNLSAFGIDGTGQGLLVAAAVLFAGLGAATVFILRRREHSA